MKLGLFKPFIWGGILILIVGLACNAGSTPVEPQATQAVEASGESQKGEQPEEPDVDASGAVSNLQDVKRAVVQIESQGTFVDPEVGQVYNSAGRGTGFIIDPSGIAVTNNHVVTGGALLKVWVEGEEAPRNARILGVSECSDLAVIDIDGEGFSYMDWYPGSTDVGMDIYIAGFPLGDPEFTLTRGIISKARADGESSWASVESVVEYDAMSNPGNSGGPVVDTDGRVVAVHYASIADYNQAFGISKTVAEGVVEKLRQGENVDTIGVNGYAVSNEDGSLTGVWVSSVQSGSAADQAGVKPGDIITMMENLVLATDGTMAQYCDILRSHGPDDTLSLEVLRWANNEVLEGQLNGRELAVAYSGDDVSGTENDNENQNENSNDNSGGDVSTSGDYVDPNASQQGEFYYYTEFDGDLSSWSYFLMNGDDEDFSAYTSDGKLRVEIDEEQTWVYFMYDDYLYSDVRIDTVAENLGRNTNNVSLICRESDDGWYEFNVYNSGEYDILWYDSVVKGDYVRLFKGGSTAIRTGKDINEYTAICNGNQLSLWINDVEVRTVTHNDLKSGRVGFSISSFNVLPIIVEFDYFVASVP